MSVVNAERRRSTLPYDERMTGARWSALTAEQVPQVLREAAEWLDSAWEAEEGQRKRHAFILRPFLQVLATQDAFAKAFVGAISSPWPPQPLKWGKVGCGRNFFCLATTDGGAVRPALGRAASER